MTTRSQKKSLKNSEKAVYKKERTENSWVLMVKDTLFDNPNFTIITLPHPSHGGPTKYCFDDQGKKMYEIVTFNASRSWFIGQTVKSDGSLLMVTPFHPAFLMIPRLKKHCMNKAIPLEDLLSEKEFDKIIDYINLDQIANLKVVGDIKAYKYNEEKTISWLVKRVEAVADVLKRKNIHVTSGAASATFVSSDIKVDPELYLKYSFGIISEYLDEYFIALLEKHFDFTKNVIECIGKRKTEETDINNVHKKLKFESSEGKEDNKNHLNLDIVAKDFKVQKTLPLTAKEKARQKAASGSKTISAFFTKK